MTPVGTYFIACSSHFCEVMILLPQFSKCCISTSWKVERAWPKQHYICPLVISWALPVAESCLSSIGARPLPYILCVSVTDPSSTQICIVGQPLGRMTIWEDCHFSAAGISICLPGDGLGLFDAVRDHLFFHGSLSDSCLFVCPFFPNSFLWIKVTLSPELASSSRCSASVLKCCWYRHVSPHLLYRICVQFPALFYVRNSGSPCDMNSRRSLFTCEMSWPFNFLSAAF